MPTAFVRKTWKPALTTAIERMAEEAGMTPQDFLVAEAEKVESQRLLAARFGVSMRTLIRWLQIYDVKWIREREA